MPGEVEKRLAELETRMGIAAEDDQPEHFDWLRAVNGAYPNSDRARARARARARGGAWVELANINDRKAIEKAERREAEAKQRELDRIQREAEVAAEPVDPITEEPERAAHEPAPPRTYPRHSWFRHLGGVWLRDAEDYVSCLEENRKRAARELRRAQRRQLS